MLGPERVRVPVPALLIVICPRPCNVPDKVAEPEVTFTIFVEPKARSTLLAEENPDASCNDPPEIVRGPEASPRLLSTDTERTPEEIVVPPE